MLPNNEVTISAIKKAVTDVLGKIEFDYLLFEPRYYYNDSKSYLTYNMTAYRDGKPIVSLKTEGDCDKVQPSPPIFVCPQG